MFVAFNSFIMIFVFHDGIKGIKHGIRSAGKWIGIMAILLLASRLLLVKSMSMPSAKIALIVALRRSSLIFSTFFGGEIFKDKHLKQRTLVSLIMVAGAILIVL
jgi:hypothetical protein